MAKKRLVRFDGVDADWFDRQKGAALAKGTERLRALEEMPVFLVDIPLAALDSFLFDKGSFDDRAWFEIDLAAGIGAALFRNLHADNERVSVSQIKQVTLDTASVLEQMCDLDEWVESDEQVMAFLDRMPRPAIERVIVYEMEHGRANGLAQNGDRPIIYFDFGEGVLPDQEGDRSVAPGLCLCATPIMFLSDWNSSHWSYAPKLPIALGMYWVAPLQKVSPSEIVFAGSIALEGGKLRVSNAAAGSRFLFGNLELSVVKRSLGRDNGHAFSVRFKTPLMNDQIVLPLDAEVIRNVVISARKGEALSQERTKTGAFKNFSAPIVSGPSAYSTAIEACPYCSASEGSRFSCRS